MSSKKKEKKEAKNKPKSEPPQLPPKPSYSTETFQLPQEEKRTKAEDVFNHDIDKDTSDTEDDLQGTNMKWIYMVDSREAESVNERMNELMNKYPEIGTDIDMDRYIAMVFVNVITGILVIWYIDQGIGTVIESERIQVKKIRLVVFTLNSTPYVIDDRLPEWDNATAAKDSAVWLQGHLTSIPQFSQLMNITYEDSTNGAIRYKFTMKEEEPRNDLLFTTPSVKPSTIPIVPTKVVVPVKVTQGIKLQNIARDMKSTSQSLQLMKRQMAAAKSERIIQMATLLEEINESKTIGLEMRRMKTELAEMMNDIRENY